MAALVMTVMFLYDADFAQFFDIFHYIVQYKFS